MKKTMLVLMLLMVSFILIFYSCKKNEPAAPEPDSITPEQLAAIKTGYSEITPILDSALLSADPVAAFKKLVDVIKAKTAVESAYADSSTIYVKFKYGGMVMWSVVPPDDTTSTFRDKPLKQVSGDPVLVGNKLACLLNQQYDDEDRPYTRQYIEEMYQSLTDHGYTVTIRNGTDVNLSFIKNNLKDYGAIYYISHGCYNTNRLTTWISTGENAGSLPIDSVLHKYNSEWRNEEIAIMNSTEMRNGNEQVIPIYNFSQDYIDAKFSAGAFPGSLLYFVACQSFKGGSEFPDIFRSKGAGVVIGWDESNCRGQVVGRNIFNYLLEGYTVREIFNTIMTDNDKLCTCTGVNARVHFSPFDGGEICLVKKANVITNYAGNISITKATMYAKINPQGIPTTGTFEYGLTTAYGNSVQCKENPVNGNQSVDVSADVTNLLPETTYHFRIKASTQSGNMYGEDRTFKTKMAVIVETKAATQVTTTTATLNATINPGSGPATAAFEYGLTTQYGNIVELAGSFFGFVAIPLSVDISGLTPNTYYHFRIKGEKNSEVIYGDDLSFKTLDGTLHIGQSYQGGKIFYIDGTGQHGLIAAPYDQSSDATWGCTDQLIGGTSTALGTGQANTTAIVNACSEVGIAARICDDLVLNGYSDWFLPSQVELNLMYPLQNQIGGFVPGDYWTSSEHNANSAWEQVFGNGYPTYTSKYYRYYVRAIRAF